MKTHNPAHIAAFPPELPPTRRYTLAGDPVAEGQVKQDLSRLAADADGELRPELIALVLVGRFARGEGGVVTRHGEPQADPSYRCLAILSQDTPNVRRRAEALAALWTEQLGVPVHIHCHDRAALRRTHQTLWWLDVARGNAEVLCGDRHALQHLRAVDVADIHTDEIGWLMTRACAQLALAWIAPEPEPHRVNLLLHRLALACGDATLLMAGRFGATLRSREMQLAGLGEATKRVSAYHAATAFLGAPEDIPPPSLKQLRARVVMLGRWHMELEHARSGAPETPVELLRFRGRLFSGRRAHATRPGTWKRLIERTSLEYPYVGDARERLLRASAGLAYSSADRSCVLLAARLLRVREGRRTPTDLQAALRALCERVVSEYHPDAVPADFYA